MGHQFVYSHTTMRVKGKGRVGAAKVPKRIFSFFLFKDFRGDGRRWNAFFPRKIISFLTAIAPFVSSCCHRNPGGGIILIPRSDSDTLRFLWELPDGKNSGRKSLRTTETSLGFNASKPPTSAQPCEKALCTRSLFCAIKYSKSIKSSQIKGTASY